MRLAGKAVMRSKHLCSTSAGKLLPSTPHHTTRSFGEVVKGQTREGGKHKVRDSEGKAERIKAGVRVRDCV
ncbi:hypothetical protein D4764_05G0006420 [Takifugu flavidus]|uniref:Uncharacterized protein n=1 Tax=Takifugu flavidus TaxID=433684 RepID=A0A5C6MZG1_9TELE|nr:hypothetical protein D4764_05G0006420 [Takifugu flavidus]